MEELGLERGLFLQVEKRGHARRQGWGGVGGKPRGLGEKRQRRWQNWSGEKVGGEALGQIPDSAQRTGTGSGAGWGLQP